MCAVGTRVTNMYESPWDFSPCNTLQCLKNQCPRAQKDEYRAFQLSFFFFLKIFLPSNRFKRQYDTVFILVKKMLSLCKDLSQFNPTG